MRTYEEKLAWVQAATNEELLEEFANIDRCSQFDKVFTYAERWGVSPKDIFSDRSILRNEVLRRMSNPA